MLKAYKYRIYPNKKKKDRYQKHLDAAVLFIIRRLHQNNSSDFATIDVPTRLIPLALILFDGTGEIYKKIHMLKITKRYEFHKIDNIYR